MTDGVPYQAYRSKRQSQTLSVVGLVVGSPSPVVGSPSSVVGSPSPVVGSPSPVAVQPSPVSLPSPVISSPGPVTSSPSPSAPSPSSQSPSHPTLSQHVTTPPKQTSTFRRIPRRPPLPVSPLAAQSPNHSLPASPTPAPSPLPTHSDPLPNQPSPAPPVISTSSRSATASPPPQRSHVPSRSVTSTPPLRSHTHSRSATSTPSQRPQAPYRPGFQPKGLYRPLTDEFLALRRLKRDGDPNDPHGPTGMKRVERTKLQRRFEKLIDLHFPPEDDSLPRRPLSAQPDHHPRASSFFDFDIRKINISDPGGLFRGVIGKRDLHDIRAAEQRITPWQEDADVTKCPLCTTSFHPLTNRKHHCRLCGQIICSLPVKHPHRPAPCSLLFVVDPKTRRIEQVDEGVDYGVRRKPLDNGAPHVPGKGGPAAEDKFLKGVRICRTCRPILLRQQYQYEITHIPTFTKLYEAFIALEQEIEESLPQFQELVLSLSHNDQPTKEASISRKRLLEAFAQYDALAKRIRKLPCPPGSSADQVQSSILNRASLFLQKNMFPLQSLPTPKKLLPKTSAPAPNGNGNGNNDAPEHHVDPDSEMAMALQPLLEQEALLESFVEEAKAHRKFEDVKTLKTNLREIRAEIEKMVANAEGGMNGNANL